MVLNDPLANVLSAVENAERIGRQQCTARPSAKLIREVLSIMQQHRYLGDAETLTDGNIRSLKINLLGKVNACGVIKPRYAVKSDEYEKFEKRYLPAQGMGILIVSTSKGMMTQVQAREQRLGGRLIAYVY